MPSFYFIPHTVGGVCSGKNQALEATSQDPAKFISSPNIWWNLLHLQTATKSCMSPETAGQIVQDK